MKSRLPLPTAIFVAGIICNPLIWSRAQAAETGQADRSRIVATQEGDRRGPPNPVNRLGKKDAEITKQIRQGLQRNQSLSTYAKNVEIVADDGKVTLRGPVMNEAELKAVLRSANSAVGSARVQNEMTIYSGDPSVMTPGSMPPSNY